ncbi:MAG: TolC family protein [Flavobacteriales bacterium]|nr:TolC family protein [Flavobacteriales bacterium]
MKIIILAALIGLTVQNVAQNSFSLDAAKQYALEHNKDFQNARLDELIMKKKVWETTAQGLPQVSAEGKFQNYVDIPTQVLPANAFNPAAPADQLVGVKFGTDYNVNGSISVSQLVFSGNYIVGLQAVKASTELYSVLSEKKAIDIKANVTEAYYTVLVLKENRGILDETLLTMQELLSSTQKLVDEKVMVATNAKQLELSVLQVQNGIAQIDAQISMAKDLLKYQMGMPLNNTIEVEGTLDIANEEAMQVSPNQNIDYILLENQLDLNELSLKNTKANYLPTLAAFLTHQQVAQRNEFNFFDGEQPWYPTTIWGLQLSVPIFSSGQKAAQVSQAKIEVEKTQNQLEFVEQGLQLQINQATTNYTLAQQTLELKRKSIEVAQQVFDDNQILYKEGVVSSIELTQSQSQLLQTQTEYTNALYELVKAKVALDKLANKL